MKKRNSRTFLPIRPGKNKDKSAAAEHSGSDETSSSFCDARYCPETGIAVRRYPARGRSHKARARQRSNSRLCEEASAEAGPLSMNGQSCMFTKKTRCRSNAFRENVKNSSQPAGPRNGGPMPDRPLAKTRPRCSSRRRGNPACGWPRPSCGRRRARRRAANRR